MSEVIVARREKVKRVWPLHMTVTPHGGKDPSIGIYTEPYKRGRSSALVASIKETADVVAHTSERDGDVESFNVRVTNSHQPHLPGTGGWMYQIQDKENRWIP